MEVLKWRGDSGLVALLIIGGLGLRAFRCGLSGEDGVGSHDVVESASFDEPRAAVAVGI